LKVVVESIMSFFTYFENDTFLPFVGEIETQICYTTRYGRWYLRNSVIFPPTRAPDGATFSFFHDVSHEKNW